METNEIRTRVSLSGVSRVTKVNIEGKMFKAYSIAYVAEDEAEKARALARDELTALNAYNFFLSNVPGIKPFDINENPEGGYSSWLFNNIGIMEISGPFSTDDQAYFLNQLETFLRIIIPDIVTYPAEYGGRLVRFIHDGGKFEYISRVLRYHDIYSSYEYPRLKVSLSREIESLTKMNPSMVYISGVESVHERSVVHDDFNSIRTNEGFYSEELLSRLLNTSRKNFVHIPFPYEFDGNAGEQDILRYIRNRNVLCRYLIIYFFDTSIEPGMDAFQIPSHMFASSSIVV